MISCKHMIRCSISTIIRMISSPYFTASGRQTRSATRAAADALGKKKKPARKHVKIEYESECCLECACEGLDAPPLSTENKNMIEPC